MKQFEEGFNEELEKDAWMTRNQMKVYAMDKILASIDYVKEKYQQHKKKTRRKSTRRKKRRKR